MNYSTFSIRSLAALAALMTLAFTPARSQVDLKFGGGIGVMIPASDFGGSTQDYYNGSRYGLGNGILFGL